METSRRGGREREGEGEMKITGKNTRKGEGKEEKTQTFPSLCSR